MHLPYSRPRLIEIHEQTWCPPFIRQQVQIMLTAAWTTKLPLIQQMAPFEAVARTLEGIIDGIEDEDRAAGINPTEGSVGIVDCCSGAGGPMPAIEKQINANRQKASRPPVKFLLTDIHPHLQSWKQLSKSSPTSSLSYIPTPVDATRFPPDLIASSTSPREQNSAEMSKDDKEYGGEGKKNFRTFCLAFHHFDEDGARRVLEDSMRSSEGIGIFELQGMDFGSFLTITLLFPLCWILTPFHRPSISTLIFTYLIPIIPLILVLDGYVSSYRTRTYPHILHLANQASMSVSLEGGGGGSGRRRNHRVGLGEEEDDEDEGEWKWEGGRVRHTWPVGHMTWVVGRRDRKGDE